MGGSTLPTASTDGYGAFVNNGRTFVACDCLRAWLPVVEALGIARGLIKESLDIVQLTGKAAASAGVHSKGGAFDVKQRSDPWIALFREAGAEATWRREGKEWEGNEHAHGALSRCPHNGPVEYQIIAARRGYNGLGQATSGPYAGMWGYGGRDPHPAPKVRRDWREGIKWAKAELAKLEAAAIPTPEEDDLMAMTPAERAALIADIATAVVDRKVISHVGDPAPLRSHAAMANWRASDLQGSVLVIRRMLAEIAGKVGVDVDEKALAAEIVTSLAPAVREAVIAAGQPDAVADAVVAKLGAALAPTS